MAGPSTFNGEELLVQISDGASPAVYSHRCIINTNRSFSRSAQTTQEVVPDCDDPAAPGWMTTEVDGLSATISGEGMVDVASLDFFDDWFEAGSSKSVKVKANVTGGRTYTGSYKLTQFDISGARKSKATASITLVSTGSVTGADNA